MFKPAKCRSLSISSRRPKSVVFYLKDPLLGTMVPLRTLENDPFKFLSSTVTFENKPQDHLVVLKDKIMCKLAKLDNTLVRPEEGGRSCKIGLPRGNIEVPARIRTCRGNLTYIRCPEG